MEPHSQAAPSSKVRPELPQTYERNWEMVPWEDMAHTPRCSDPEDQMFINLGVAGNADILVARDRSLLMMDGDLPFRIMNEQDFRGAMLG